MGKTRGLAIVLGVALVVGSADWTSRALAAEPAIQTVFASYGYAGERKDAKDDVAKVCDGKPSCSFMVKDESFPTKQPLDPSPGNDKGLMVRWTCGDAAYQTQFAEGKKATVDCSGDAPKAAVKK
jgi:hypothetical protein